MHFGELINDLHQLFSLTSEHNKFVSMLNNGNRKEKKNILNVKVIDENVLETNTDIIRYTLKETIRNNKCWL